MNTVHPLTSLHAGPSPPHPRSQSVQAVTPAAAVACLGRQLGHAASPSTAVESPRRAVVAVSLCVFVKCSQRAICVTPMFLVRPMTEWGSAKSWGGGGDGKGRRV